MRECRAIDSSLPSEIAIVVTLTYRETVRRCQAFIALSCREMRIFLRFKAQYQRSAADRRHPSMIWSEALALRHTTQQGLASLRIHD